jgi:Flp pilus assembly protein TadD
MPRFTASLSIVAVSALLAGTALGATPEAPSSAATMNQSLETSIKDAQMKRSQRDFTGAVHVLSQLMLVAADDPRVVGEYGKVLVQQGRSREALDFLNRAVQLQQGDWSLYSALGVAYDQSGDYNSARGAYERALALKPGEAAVLNNFAMSRALAGDLATAKKLISDASAGSKDERVARNLKMINSLTPKVAAVVPPPAVKAAAPSTAIAAPRQMTPAEGKTVVMQAVPSDPKAGPTNKSKPRKTGTATAKQQPSGIPALRLANDRQ